METFLTEEEKRTWRWVKSGPHKGKRIIRFIAADRYPNDTFFVQLAACDCDCGCGQWDCPDQRGCFVNVAIEDIDRDVV
jgi:hypothetical protein